MISHYMSKCQDWEGLGGHAVVPKNRIRDILASFFVQWEDVDASSILIRIDSLSSW